MRRRIGAMLALAGCLVAGCGHLPFHPTVSPRLKALDADPKAPLPGLIDAALEGSPYAGKVQSTALPVEGTAPKLLLRVHLAPAAGDDARQAQDDVHHQLADVLGRLLVPLNHHQIRDVILSVTVPGPHGEIPVETDELHPNEVNTTDVALGGVVPPDRVLTALKIQSTWDRLQHP